MPRNPKLRPEARITDATKIGITKQALLRTIPTVKILVVLQDLDGRPDYLTAKTVREPLLERGWIEPAPVVGDLGGVRYRLTPVGEKLARAFTETSLRRLIVYGAVREILERVLAIGVHVEFQRAS